MLFVAVLFLAPAITFGEVVSERFGGAKGSSAHPQALKVELVTAERAVAGQAGETVRCVFDLSAIPKGSAVYRASLSAAGAGRGQPREPVRVVKALADGKAADPGAPGLALEAPYYRSLDATEAAKGWVADPSTNLGFALLDSGGLDPKSFYLDVWFEGKPAADLPQVEGLKAAHAHGQTFLVWKELPEFRPAADKVLWVEQFDYRKPVLADGPGKNAAGGPRVGAVTLETLRGLEGFAVRIEPGKGQAMSPQKRVKQNPDVHYRVYRSKEQITAKNIGSAELVGEANPLNAYDTNMIMGGHIGCRGEYYEQYEIPDSLFKTWAYGQGEAVAPGEAVFAFTLPEGQAGKYFYAVTAWKAGTENLAVISDGNSLKAPVDEKADTPQPVLQHVRPGTVFGKPKEKTTEYFYAFYLAPPAANVPRMDPKRIVVLAPEVWKAGALDMISTSVGAFWGPRVSSSEYVMLYIQDDGLGGDLGYNEGLGTLKPFRGSQVRFYSEKYLFTVLDWALAKWQADRTRIRGGGSTHFSARHPEFFGALLMGPPFASGFSLDFDQKWNPASGSLGGRLGPPELVKGPDGGPAWDMFDLTKYLLNNQDKDIPFMGCMFSQPKDGNHGAEYGWQDDPKGLAALRDARQPYAATWGGPGLPGEVSAAYGRMRWDKTLPAFSNCSLDNNPGTGDPDAGEPWGQINAYLLWDCNDSVDANDPLSWEMTVQLIAAAPQDSCTVDITPRHCKLFKPKPGAKFKWTSTALPDGKATGSGAPTGDRTVEVAADKWGLVTLKQISLSKGKQRLKIVSAG